MESLKDIENKLKAISESENVKLEIVMNLRKEALEHHKICNDVLKEIKETLKQNNEQ